MYYLPNVQPQNFDIPDLVSWHASRIERGLGCRWDVNRLESLGVVLPEDVRHSILNGTSDASSAFRIEGMAASMRMKGGGHHANR